MAREFNLPDLGSGLQEGEIVAWHVKVGDAVTGDSVLCEIETEKAVVEIPVPFDGVVLSLGATEGETIAVGGVLVVIGTEAELGKPVTAGGSAAGEPVTTPASQPAAATMSTVAGRDPAVVPSGLLRAMPLVRRLARQHSIDLATVVGTGVGGRITRKDIEAVIAANGEARVSPEPATPAPAPAAAEDEHRPLSRLRRSVAAHMTAQWQQVPHITGNADADAGRLLAVRKAAGERLGRKVPFDALIVAAAVPALKQFPEMNAAVDGDELVIKHRYDIGFAVGSEDGLLVPVVRNADRLTLAELIDTVADLAERARVRKLAPDELGDQTFTISNLGPVGGDHATQIIPAGTVAIASFGRIREQPVVRDGAIAVASVMAVSGSFDHRAVDGAPAMRFLHAIIDAIEEPALLLL
jgi:pyruvate dehydrogenase E2 component (dihydrolipoamide acetyltransferase)